MNRYHLDDIQADCAARRHPGKRITSGEPGANVVTCDSCGTVIATTDRAVWDAVTILNKRAGYE